MKTLFITLGLLSCLLLIACQAPAQDVPLPIDPQLIRGELENGFSYYIRKMDGEHTKGKIQIGLVGRMGEWLEDEKQDGLAHLIEHMVVLSEHSRYEKINAKEWLKDISMVGGGAATYPHKVSYVQTLHRTGLLDAYLEYTRAVAWDPLILKNLLDTAMVNITGRQTVLQESRVWWRSVPEQEMEYLMFGEPGHPGMEPDRVAREVHNIKTFDVKDLRRYYEDWYRPDMQALVVVGDIPDTQELESRIKELFSDLEMPENPREASFKEYVKGREVNLPGETRVLWVHNPHLYNNQPEARLYFLKSSPILERRSTTEQQYKESLLHNIYQRLIFQRLDRLTSMHRYNALLNANERPGFSSRSFEDVAAVNYNVSIPFENNGTFSKARLEAIYTELERVARYGPTETELDLLKEERLRGSESRLSGNGAIRSYTTALEDHFIYGSPVLAPEHKLELLKRLLLEMDARDIQQYARSVMDLRDQVLGFYLPEGESPGGLPTDRDLKVWLEDIRNQDISPLKESDFKAPEALLTQEEINRLSADISYRKTIMEGAIRLQLENGATVILKPMSGLKPVPGQSDIALTGLSSLTVSEFKHRKDYVDALKSAGLVQHTGAGEFDKFALKQYTDQHNLGLSFGAGLTGSTVSGSAPAGKEEQLLQLLYLYLSQPGTSTEAFEDWLRQERENLSESGSTRRSGDFLGKVRTLIEGEPQERTGEPPVSGEELSEINPESAYQRFQQLYSPENLTLVLTGNFDTDTVIPLLLRYLGNLSGKAPEETELKEIEPNTTEVVTHYPLKQGMDTTWYEGDKSWIYMGWEGEIAQPEDILKLEILERVIHGDLFSEITKMDYSYPAVTLRLYPNDRFAFFTVYDPGPGAMQVVEDIMRKVIAEKRMVGMDSIRFESQKKALEDRYQNDYGLESNTPAGMGAYLLEVEMKTPGPRTQARQRLNMLEGIDPESVREAAGKYLDEEKLNIIRSLPEKDRIDQQMK